jgi:3-oxoacyl-[acyl-carrier protein] reductase
MASTVRSPQPEFAAHVTAKAGLNTFAKYVAEEYGEHGIRANVVSPGLVETDATTDRLDEDVRAGVTRTTPLGRVAQPEDIAKSVAAFAGEGTQFVTGTYTAVNGGSGME